MAKLPKVASPTIDAVYRWYEEKSRRAHPRRGRLGASVIGRECERALWYKFRHAVFLTHSGRLLRLFETGNIFEVRIIDELRNIGVKVLNQDENTGQQFGFSDFGDHFAGYVDGIVLGLHEAPRTWHLLECKTSNDKQFSALKNVGVKVHKPEHYAQMIIYMSYLSLSRAIYLVVNKNTDELYLERVKSDTQYAVLLKTKARRIIESSQPLVRISDNSAWYKCKWCEYHDICFSSVLPDVNCRTCLHSTPRTTGVGGWYCEKHSKPLSPEEQTQECNEHLFIPSFISDEIKKVGDDYIEYVREGRIVRNGRGGYQSKELTNVM